MHLRRVPLEIKARKHQSFRLNEPSKNPALFLGLGLCTLLYLAINTVYLYALSPAAMAAMHRS